VRRCIPLLLIGLVLGVSACDGGDGAPSAGQDAGERGGLVSESVYAGFASTRGAIELHGGIRAASDGSRLTAIEFDLVLAGDADPLPIANRALPITYIDAATVQAPVAYSATESPGDGDGLLEAGEIGAIHIDLVAACPACAIGPNQTFTIEIKPPAGSYVVLQRTTPDSLDPVINLN
jgi:hypothetical protein